MNIADEIRVLKEKKYLEAVHKVLLEGSVLLDPPEALYLSRIKSKGGNKPFKAYRRGRQLITTLGGFDVKAVKTTNPYYSKFVLKKRSVSKFV